MASFLCPCQRCSLMVRFTTPQEPNSRIRCGACEAELAANEEAARSAKVKREPTRSHTVRR